MTIDATVGGENSNSFTTKDEANGYHLTRLHNDEWVDADISDQEKALQWATRLLDNLMWLGRQWSDTQALRWPRIEVPDREGSYWDYNEVPTWLKNATAELAWLLIISDSTRESGTKGFHMIKVGPVTMQIAANDRSQSIYDAVMEMVRPFIEQGQRVYRG
jgi:hypothetical protein